MSVAPISLIGWLHTAVCVAAMAAGAVALCDPQRLGPPPALGVGGTSAR